MRSALLLSIALIGLAACSSERELTETYREVAGNTTERWIWGGANPETLEATLQRIRSAKGERAIPEQYDTISEYGPGNWIFEFVQTGDAQMAIAQEILESGDRAAAKAAFLEASTYYQIAKYPYLKDENYPHYEAAYAKSMTAYETAGQLFEVPLEVIEIPYADGKIRGYLHLTERSADTAAPLVIASGGIDVFKVEYYPMVQRFLAQGISVLVVDLPGVGESNFVPSNPNQSEVYTAFLDVLLEDSRIDDSKVGLFASSWGGNAAARVAFEDDRFAGIVAACGPVHEALAPPQWVVDWFPGMIVDQVPPLRWDVSADRVGIAVPVKESDYSDFSARMRAFSLIEQGIVGAGEKQSVPLLIINTDDDPFAPPSDMEALAKSASQGEVHYTGPGGHCGSRDSLLDVSIPWLIEKMAKGPDA
ncbi:MAG: alpha/beta fold hydrolase [Erythrobacter sp.]